MGKIDFQNVQTMIGPDAIVSGNIELSGGLIIYGKVHGSLITDGPIRVAKSGAVHGDITASDIHIGGKVEGNVKVKNRVVLGSQSILKGDLIYRRLLIEEGAQLEGKCDLTVRTEDSDQSDIKL